MINIGIIGSQSMHAREFAKVCNLPDEHGSFLIPDCRVTAICGMDDAPEHTADIARQGCIPRILQQPEALFDFCDAVMVATRNGDNHVALALPFLRKGYPVFLDKPVCISKEDIAVLENEVRQRDCIIAGGSGMQHNRSLKELKRLMDSGEVGEVKGISLNHNGDIDSPYGGIFFYACHGVEMMLQLLGKEPRSVQTNVLTHDQFSIFVKYQDRFANLIMTSGYQDYFVNVYGEKRNIAYRIDADDIFRETMVHFANRIRKHRITKSVDDLVRHVRVLQAIETSIEKKTEVLIEK
ncbi:MAG: Gfo/Idh/MocA family oxidoreductase [Clostridia bacterium]|nr:Gfo/Idh/MocA family oxidoreductase [Clostridia bacterium]